MKPSLELYPLEQAASYLRELLSEFPFADWREEKRKIPHIQNGELTWLEPSDSDGWDIPMVRQSRSMAVQIAAMLSQFAAGVVPRNQLRMGFVYTANSVRSGKTLLVKLAIIPVHGSMRTQTYNSRDDELRKVLLAEVLRAATYIVFDNIRGFIGSQVIEAFMTAITWTDRGLGVSKMFTGNNTATLFFTGNEGTVSTDIKNRCLEVHLFVEEANAQDRVLMHEIDDAWLVDKSNRFRILSCLWSLIYHWHAAGEPAPTSNLRKGFEAWCRVIGGIVEYAGFGSPLERPPDDGLVEEGAEMHALVWRLAQYFGDGDKKELAFQFQEIVDECHEAGLFEWLLDGKLVEDEQGKRFVLKPEANSRLGKMIRRYAPTKGARRFSLAHPYPLVFLSCTGKDRARRYMLRR